MKRIKLDREPEQVKRFVRSLPLEAGGSVLELGGEPLLKVLPIKRHTYDKAKLRQAILRRRDASRKLNREWEAVDKEAWGRIAEHLVPTLRVGTQSRRSASRGG